MQVLGTIGELRRIPMVVLSVVVGAVTWTVARPRRPEVGAPRRARAPVVWSPLVVAVVVAVVAITALPWLTATVKTFQQGIGGYDSMNYHLPYAATFAQTGRITPLRFFFPGFDTPFYPDNSELLHALGMVAFRRDVVSLLLNLGWLSLALFAAWCAGRARGVATATLASVAILLGGPLFAATNGGRANNDIPSVALLLAAVALLLGAYEQPAAIGIAAAACGMALSTKLTMVAPVALLTIGLLVVAPGGRRGVIAKAWLPWLLLTGGFWYVRNLVLTGSPVPTTHIGVGPLALPTVPLVRPYPARTIAHYLTDLHAWRSVFLPGLHSTFGWGWPILALLAVVGSVLACVRRDALLGVLGATGLGSLAAYVVTPMSAGGTATTLPVLFARNLRFVYPALAIGLLLLPVASAATRGLLLWVWMGLVAFALTVEAFYALTNDREQVALALAIELVLGAVVVVAAWIWTHPLHRSVLVAGTAVLVVVFVGAGFAAQRRYLDKRYHDVSALPFASAPPGTVRMVYRLAPVLDHRRIGVAGFGFQYPLFGPHLDNDVRYVGRRGPRGEFSPAVNCRQWRQLVNEGHYDYLVLSPDARGGHEPRELAWTERDPAAERVAHDAPATAFRLHGPLDPNSC
jgi:hypothetical protein